MNEFLIIDGSSLLTTSYYGTLPKEMMYAKTEEEKSLYYNKLLQTSDGVYTNGMYTMLKTILKIIKYQQPSHIAVVFDKSRNTFRRKLYADYKGNRGTTPGPLKQQFISMENLLTDIGIQVLFSAEYEADDYAGSLAEKFCSEVPVSLMTKDADYLQLVNDLKGICVWMVQTSKQQTDDLKNKYGIREESMNLPAKTFVYTDEIVKKEYGLPFSKAIIDYKALAGDSSDNIPGVKGISTKTAAPLLMEYETVENLYQSIEADGPVAEDYWKEFLCLRKGAYKKLTAEADETGMSAMERAFLSKKLATIKTDIMIEQSIDDFLCNIDNEKLKEICRQYEFTSLLQ